jgi:hypothetical protein
MPALRSSVGVAAVLFAAHTSPPTPAQPPTPPPAGLQPGPGADAVPVLTETVGLLSGLQLYQTYLNVGLLADARAEGVYEASELAQLLGSVVTPLEQVDKQLERVAALKGLGKDDAAAVARLRKILAHLQAQGKSLQSYWDTGVADHAKKYEAARQAAWKELDDLLGLTATEGVAPEPKAVEKRP